MNEKQLALNRKWQQAGLTDDFVFNKVFLDPALTLELLRRTLPNLVIERIEILNSQQTLTGTRGAKSARLDIYAEDNHGNRFDIEMQVRDRHNMPERNRFYQSALANDSYEKGKDYSQADHSYVIFFCCFDPFGLGYQHYTIERRILEQLTFPFQDGEIALFFDINSEQRAVGPKMQRFLDLLAGRKIDVQDDFIVKLRKRMAAVKANRKWSDEYMQRSIYEMDMEIDRRQAIAKYREKGLLEGRKEGRKEGREEGLTAGRQEGFKTGHQEGRKEGRQEGRQEGREEGRQEGTQEGINEERLALVRDLVNSGQSQKQVEDFLVNIRKMDWQQAHEYYLQATQK